MSDDDAASDADEATTDAPAAGAVDAEGTEGEATETSALSDDGSGDGSGDGPAAG